MPWVATTEIRGGRVRVTIRVYPNARFARVGGRYGDREPPVLIVRVPAPAAQGRANAAAIRLLASAFEVPARSIHIVSGHGSRTKVVEVAEANEATLKSLLHQA
jgi:uncharacterized protein